MDVNKVLKKYVPNFSHLEEFEIKLEDKIVGFHSTLFLDDNKSLGNGVSTDLETSRRIAIAESLERNIVKNIKDEKLIDKLMLREFPTTCGFSFGFNNKKTMLRSAAEAVERWAWSKWIDDKNPLSEIHEHDLRLTPLSKALRNEFSSVRYFTKTLNGQLGNNSISFNLAIIVAYKDGGAFVGSRVGLAADELWEHCYIEAWRHLNIFENKNEIKDNHIFNRIIRFGESSKLADEQIPKAQEDQKQWPEFDFLLKEQIPLKEQDIYLWRILCKDYIGWHEGSDKRFVY